MSVSPTFKIIRQAVVNGSKDPCFPPQGFHSVTVGNGTASDLQIHSTDDDDLHYLVLQAGYERLLPTGRYVRYVPTSPAFWVKPSADGTVVLIWS